jgi:cytoskeletal protein RodZ
VILRTMKTVGVILREARIAKGLTIEQIEHITKIRRKFLEAIEADDYSNLPSVSYAKGFVHNYADILGLNTSHVMAFFRRQTKEVSRSSLLPKGVSEPLNRTFFTLTPSRFLGSIVSGLVIVFLLYFGLQYRRTQQPPVLVIESPQNGITVTDKRIDVLGKTDTDATVAINGVSVLIRTDGKFFDQISLEPGVNTITVTATSRFGKVANDVRSVISQPN